MLLRSHRAAAEAELPICVQSDTFHYWCDLIPRSQKLSMQIVGRGLAGRCGPGFHRTRLPVPAPP
eukprot:3812086-Amphidinium_carterae.2